MFHPTLAVVAIICMLILLIIAIANQKITTARHAEVSDKSRGISQQVQSHLRNSEVAAALGMSGRLETSGGPNKLIYLDYKKPRH